MIHFVVPREQEFGIRDYLAASGSALADRLRVVHYEALPDCTRFARGTYIFSALDQLSDGMTRLVALVHERLRAVGGCTLLNDPAHTLHRFDLLAELRRLGRNDFRAVRATADVRDLRYPVFLRAERSHDGALSPLLGSAAEVQAAIGRALVQGRRLRDLLVVEFCPTADDRGYFRKYAAFVVGTCVVPRSLAYGAKWMLKHRASEFTRPMVLEERAFIFDNPHEGQLREIFAVAGAAYGRIDYAVKDRRVQTWEINLNPTIGRGLRPSRGIVPAELEPIRDEAKQHFYRRFQEAFEAIDLPFDERPIDFEVDPLSREAARAPAAPRRRGPGRLGAVLRPLKPLLEPVAARVLPFLSTAARFAESLRR